MGTQDKQVTMQRGQRIFNHSMEQNTLHFFKSLLINGKNNTKAQAENIKKDIILLFVERYWKYNESYYDMDADMTLVQPIMSLTIQI